MHTATDGWQGARRNQSCGRQEKKDTPSTALLRGGAPEMPGVCQEQNCVQSLKTGLGTR